MTNQEHEEMLDSLFPVGQERWIKVKYLDRDKCLKAFFMRTPPNETAERHQEQGYEITAIGVKDEYTPQISALKDVKDSVIALLYGQVSDTFLSAINEQFTAVMDDLKERTIQASAQEGE